MSHLRFNHVFVFLMFLSAASAFVFPMRMTNAVRAQVQNVFAPVSKPVGAVASWARGKVVRPENTDPRDALAVFRENENLKTAVANLVAQVRYLQEINADRQLLGEVLPLCTPAPVVGGDAGQRDSLSIQSTDNIQPGMYALYSGGVVGRVDRAGVSGGAQVRLITDAGFAVTGRFGRFVTTADGKTVFQTIDTPPPLVQGVGRGSMIIRRLDMDSVREVEAGDWVIVQDRDWPANLQGYRIGRVTAIGPSTGSPLFAEIEVKPATNLMLLREVMVLNKTSPAIRSAKTE